MVAFPAYAGMNRVTTASSSRPLGVPRVCGDEPIEAVSDYLEQLRSPRMRG